MLCYTGYVYLLNIILSNSLVCKYRNSMNTWYFYIKCVLKFVKWMKIMFEINI